MGYLTAKRGNKMGDLSRNLSRSEFACQCGCGFDTVDFELVNVLQTAVIDMENRFDEKVIIVITGPNRCNKHNAKVGGAKNSQHIYAKAVDHKFYIVTREGVKQQIDPDIVYEYYDKKYRNKYGVGKYGNRTHIDVRKRKARWDARK